MLTATIAFLVLGQGYSPRGPQIRVNLDSGKFFVIQCDEEGSPKTTAGIVKLVKKKFYDGQRFHRVETWVTQWGDPVSKKSITDPKIGDGGSGIPLPFEEARTDFVRGVVGIASEGFKQGGDSQLFILTKDALRLNPNYACLGKVTLGMDVVDTINVGTRIKSMEILKARIPMSVMKKRG